MVITFGGALVILTGILIMVATVLIAYFDRPQGWLEIILLVILFLVGFCATMGGSEMKG